MINVVKVSAQVAWQKGLDKQHKNSIPIAYVQIHLLNAHADVSIRARDVIFDLNLLFHTSCMGVSFQN